MKKNLVCLAAICAALLGAGCSSSVKYVDSNSSNLIVNADKINIQDFASAADEMMQDLIDFAGADLTGADGEKPIIAISRVKNNTQENFDVDLLVKKMRTTLTKTKKVYTTTTLNLEKGEDPLAEEALEMEERTTGTNTLHNYTLSGKILQVTAKAGSKIQNSFVFQLSLSDRRGLVLWENEKIITKQGSRAKVGF